MVSVLRYRGYGLTPLSAFGDEQQGLSPHKNGIRRLDPTDKRRRPSFFASSVSDTDVDVVKYEVRVTTGKKKGAGTDANVYISFFGTNGEGEKLQLAKTSKSTFQLGGTDCFIVDLPVGLGELTKLCIGHDDTGLNAAWLLDCVHVTNRKTLVSTVFLCNEWLDNKHGTSRELKPLQVGSCEGATSINTTTSRNHSAQVKHTFWHKLKEIKKVFTFLTPKSWGK